MNDSEIITQFLNAVDGISAVGLAVWVISLLMRQLSEARGQSDELIDRVNETNKELIGLVRDWSHSTRPYSLPSTQPRPPEFESKVGP